MNNKRWRLAQLTFYGWIAFQTIAMAGYNDMMDFSWNLVGIKITVYAAILALALLFSIFGLITQWNLSEDPNRLIIVAIVVYTLYQCIVVLPLSLSAKMTLPPNVVDYFALRFQVLMIPFLYWFVLPSFRKNDSAIKLLCYSSLIPLGSAMFDLSRGIVGHTDNGELRLLWGGVSLLYAFVLITNLRFFSHTKTNFFLAVVAGVGLTLANHRSAYLVIAFLIIVVLLVSNRGSSRLPGITSLGIGVLLVVAVLISVPSLWESFLSRLSTSLDTNDINAVGRLSRWELSWTFFLSNPLNGSMLSYQYYGVQLRDNFPPHNFVFELLTTEGVVGTMFYLLLIFWIARIAFSHRWDQTMWQMFLAIIFYVGFCLFNTNFLGPWNFLEFALPCSMVMFRHQCLTSD